MPLRKIVLVLVSFYDQSFKFFCFSFLFENFCNCVSLFFFWVFLFCLLLNRIQHWQTLHKRHKCDLWLLCKIARCSKIISTAPWKCIWKPQTHSFAKTFAVCCKCESADFLLFSFFVFCMPSLFYNRKLKAWSVWHSWRTARSGVGK